MNHTNFYAITTQVSYCATSVQKTGATEAIVDERAIFKLQNPSCGALNSDAFSVEFTRKIAISPGLIRDH